MIGAILYRVSFQSKQLLCIHPLYCSLFKEYFTHKMSGFVVYTSVQVNDDLSSFFSY